MAASAPSPAPRRSALLGVTWIALAGLLVSTVQPSTDRATTPVDEAGSMQLLESAWEDASTLETLESAKLSPITNEYLAGEIIDEANAELSDATTALHAAPADNWTDAIADAQLHQALVDAEEAIQEAEAVLAMPGEAPVELVERVDAQLITALEEADTRLAAAVADASPELIGELEQAGDALDGAAAVLSELDDADDHWVTDLEGWAPNLRYAIDRRGPKRKLSGQGIDIVLIDSGVTPVHGLHGPDKIVNGPDLSPEASDPTQAHLDGFGHGTHMAGIIAGNDNGTAVGGVEFSGIAPDARLINVKVADSTGATSMDAVIAGIEWAIVHRNDNGMNIRVITLALGHDEADYMMDPLAAALEAAWEAGIVVVVAGGNDGIAAGRLDSPAIDPYVIAVAGTDAHDPTNMSDDTVAEFSSIGDGNRNPDIAAPGKSVISLRVPGSTADVAHPESRIGSRFAVASGTSQSTAVAAGTVALLLERNPELSPDQVKRLFTDAGRNVAPGQNRDGNGRLRLNRSLWLLRTGKIGPAVSQFHPKAEAPADFGTMNGGWSGGTWSGGTWSGATWSGATWSGGTWSGATWSGATWSGATWSGATWSGATWSGATWSGATWSGATWSGATWN